MANIYIAVNWAISIAADDTHGYDQQNRNGPDYDCSSFVSTALNLAGFNISPTSWTGNMLAQLLSCGFTSIPINAPRQLGDVFLHTVHHTAISINANEIAEATINELGTVTGGQTGDQTGDEIAIHSWYDYPWEYHLRPPADSYNHPLPSAQWHAKNTGAYARNSTEAFDNGIMCFALLTSLGWSANAIAAVWGNIGSESGYNPWRWESDVVLASTDTTLIQESFIHGYGLPQFTPAGKYILSNAAQAYYEYAPNFSDVPGNPNDGEAQLRFISEHADYYPSMGYQISFDDFKISGDSPEYLAEVWLYNYERPGDPSATIATRRADARYWYDIFSQYSPIFVGSKKLPIWMMIRRNKQWR